MYEGSIPSRVSYKNVCLAELDLAPQDKTVYMGSIPIRISKMKRPALILVFLTLLASVVFVSKAGAQAFDFNKSYQDYQYSLGVYQTAYTAYVGSRDFYQKNPTLTLKEDARQKTLTMLRSRDQLTAVYLTMLRMKLVETKGLSGDDKNNIFGKIDPEVKWYQDHFSDFQDGDPLESLFSKSDESRSRYKTNTLPIIYEAVFDISLGTELGMQEDMYSIYSSLKDIVNTRVVSGDLDINLFNRWFTDIDTVIATLNQNEGQGKTQIAKIYGQYYSIVGFFNTSADTLASSLSSLSQLNRFLTEVLTSLKNQL